MKIIKRNNRWGYRRAFGSIAKDPVLVRSVRDVAWRWTWPMSVFGHPYAPKGFMKHSQPFNGVGE